MATWTVGHLEKVRALAASGSMLVVGGVRAGAKSSLTLFDAAANKAVRSIEVPSHVLSVAFVGNTLVAGCLDGWLRSYDASTGAAGPQALAHVGGCLAIAASADGARLATAGADGNARTWLTVTLAAEKTFTLSNHPLRAVAYSTTHLAAAGDDSVVHVLTLADGARRDMPGHSGPVFALTFTPRDGRLVSAGDDGTVRLWFLDGAIEAEVRGANEQGHAGGAFGLVFGPLPANQPDAPDRLYSVGADAKVKVWRLDERRKPKSFDLLDAVRAVALVPPPAGVKDTLGTVVAGGDGRALLFVTLGADGQPRDATNTGDHGLRVLEQQAASSQRPGREAAARTLAALEEPEALTLLLKLLAEDKEPEVRALCAQLLGQHGRRDARPALRDRLDDAHEKVRAQALAALLTLEGDNAVAALRAGLRSKHADVRRAAVAKLPPLYPASPLVPGLVQGALTDADATVRLAALAALVGLHPAGSFEPFRVAFERGTPDLRVEAMVRALALGDAQFPGVWWMTGRALDDEDAEVRRFGFAVRVLTRRPLAGILQHRFGNFQRMLTDVLRRVALSRRAAGATQEVTDAELAEAKKLLRVPEGSEEGELADAELEPLLLAIACRTSDTSLRGTVAMLSLLEDQRAIGALLQLSRDPSAAIRSTVAGVLGHLEAGQAEQRLVAMLEDADGNVRSAAADAWSARAKERPLDFARGLLRSAFEDVRVRGLTTLMQGQHSPEAEGLLEHALEDESPKVRAEAFRTLWSWGQKTPEKALDRALAARFADLRLKAVEELATVAQVPRDDEAKPPASPPEWAVTRLRSAVADRDAQVGLKAFEAVRRLTTADRPDAVLLALASTVAEVRRTGAQWAAKVKKDDAEALRSPVLRALQDEELPVRLQALEALDALFPKDNGPLTAGLLTDRHELKVRAAELLARRHDEAIIEPMRGMLLDKELLQKHPPAFIQPLRERAAGALATLGSPRCIALFATTLLKDENPGVREQASRGLCNAGEKEATGPLLDALGHADVAVRSWAAEGLARLGDDRGLPVLTGTLRDPHVPIREGAIRSLVAVGEVGNSGLLAGLDDPERRIQETFFAVLMARDWRMYRNQQAPELLTAALSSQKAEIRFAAARALELRTEPEPYTGYLVELLLPPKPEKATEMKDWPPEAEREHLMVALADQLGSTAAADRYAAGQALLLRSRPLEYFAEIRRITRLKAPGATVVPDTTPRAPAQGQQKKDWLRALFASHKKAGTATAGEAAQLRWLAFGAYVGILREKGGDELARVRRDTVDRIVALGEANQPPASSAVPPLVRALDDEDHLVRRQALAGLKRLLAGDKEDTALRYALTSASADVAKAALDEIAGRGEAGKTLITGMLNGSLGEVRKHAFELLVKLSPPGSLDPLLAAFSCQHADLRLGVLERLAASTDPRVTDALGRALESEHDDLRLRAAELLVDRRDDRAVPVLAAFIRSEDAAVAAKARKALVRLRSPAAVRALAARLDEVTTADHRKELIGALKDADSAEGLEALLKLVSNEEVDVAAFEAGVAVGHFWRPDEDDPEGNEKRAKQTPRDGATLVKVFTAAVKSKKPEVRLAAATRMDVGPEKELDGLLVSLFGDRDAAVRVAAVTAYATRVEKLGAAATPLEEVLRQGARELMLPAAEGLSHQRHAASFRPLLLFVRAGEAGERERALKALGTVGDVRALEELESVASGGTPEVPFDQSMQGAALEGLGRLYRHLKDADERKRVWERVENASAEGPLQPPGILALQAIGDGRACARLEQLALTNGVPEPARLQAIDALSRNPGASEGTEATLGQCLKAQWPSIRARAKKALHRLFPNEPMRVALLAADSIHADVAAPAIAFLVAEAEPAGLLERLAKPLDAGLRESLRVGLVQRKRLPTDALVKLTQAQSPAAREDVAWLMAMHALSAADLPEQERAARARSLAEGATKTAERWAKALGAERAAEERAWRRLLWAAVLNAAKDVVPVAKQVLAKDSKAPPAIRQEAARALVRAGGDDATTALTEAASDQDASVRRTAIAGLARLDAGKARGLIGAVKPLDAVAFAPVADAQMLITDAGRQVALPSIVAKADTALLQKLARDGDTDALKLAALAALGRIGGEDVVKFLESLAVTGEGGGDDGDEDEAEDDDGDDGDGDEDDEGGGGGEEDVTMPGARRFEMVEDGHSKFWEVVVEGDIYKVRYGKIGQLGQTKIKDLGSPAGAQKEADKMIREKTGKGYEEVKPKGRKPLVAVKPKADAGGGGGGGEPWGTEELRKAAFRAFKRASRATEKRSGAPKWFSPREVEALASGSGEGAAALVAPSAPAAGSPGGGGLDLDRSIDELELSVRTANALEEYGLSTVGEVIDALKGGELDDLGGKSLRELKELLTELGADLSGGDEDEGEDDE